MRIGLALSGGGFRATLYHLGMVRWLRDAGLLTSVSHITSVSGGSVLAAHLALNWDRYCGDEKDFDAAANELVDFVQLDVRNRILRRYPFTLAGGAALRMVGMKPKRRLTRTMLLERHYRRRLFGDTCLHQLPRSPELHILCTNLSGGGLSSFTRDGLLMEERGAGGRSIMRLHEVGLATVPMAVAASSAFPGFFPPLELTAETVGATPGEFQTQFFTDGGVYDNLGIRMYDHLNNRLRESLHEEDFLDVGEAMQAWRQAARAEEATPLRRLVEIGGQLSVDTHVEEPGRFTNGLRRLVASRELHLDLTLQELIYSGAGCAAGGGGDSDAGRLAAGADPPTGAAVGPRFAGSGGASRDAQLRNLDLLAIAFERAAGKEILRPRDRPFDAILASDAGKKIQVSSNERMGGLLGTAMRSSDILMDRVWQLEQEHFRNATGVIFSPITRRVAPELDPTAPHPDVQQQVGHIRTDMDRFSDREISGLLRHGYCVARQSWSDHAPDGAAHSERQQPWDPTPLAAARAAEAAPAAGRAGAPPSYSTLEARKLQDSSRRRYLSLLIAPRDWVTHLYIPVLLVLLGVIPWAVWSWHHHVQVNAMLSGAITQSRHDYDQLLSLLEFGPVEPWAPVDFETADQPLPIFADHGLDMLSDARIVDLRNWRTAGPGDARVYVCRHVSVRKVADMVGPTSLRLQSLWNTQEVQVRCRNRELSPVVRRSPLAAYGGRERFLWEVQLDFSRVAVGETVHLVVETIVQGDAQDRWFSDREWWRYEVDGDPELAAAWILLPTEKGYKDFHVVKYKDRKHAHASLVEPSRKSVIQRGSILNWEVIKPDPEMIYSCRWADGA
ncbi:Patatin-like phospholipase [Posidoniimonas corsicana]|uniref:Patatin-like phospholipase n=1 Tax=Posidoniimonas corsicana TaxID=1938618 RepID=A0A5C5VEI8_9BACT|nr:patatin-like phospholipase family protein [Posidoniimonas corsicana]TWT37064.1 Patatin-like phospholipase [Posidoniimonas corsicana]